MPHDSIHFATPSEASKKQETAIQNPAMTWFEQARYGLFVHFGLYSMLGRGEWVVNREQMPIEALEPLADKFAPHRLDADALADLAVAGGMRYLIFTTMHHEGFRMYDSQLSGFCSTRRGPCRDFTAEVIRAARERGLKIGLYHSLNNWFDQPDGVAALENSSQYAVYIENTLGRIQELVTQYNPVDILWYDGWWPFDAVGWQAERMNEMVRKIQPHILFNGRNGLPGDFATPEQHLTAPHPWRPWGACVTLNDHWGFHAGDSRWKSPREVVSLLTRVAQRRGNLLLNIGPRGDGSIPEESERVIRRVGQWLKINQEALWETDFFTWDHHQRGDHAGDFSHHGPFTCKGNILYWILTTPPCGSLVVSGLECQVARVQLLGGGPLAFSQQEGRLQIEVPDLPVRDDELPTVLKLECDRPPVIYKTAGMRVPAVPHPRYDPLPSDLAS